MNKLLRADNTRMLRSATFRFGLLSLLALLLITFFLDGDKGTLQRTEAGFQSLLLFLPLVCGFLIILSVGAEFGNGAIRNKLIVGHRRSHVYTSWMVTGIAVTLISFVFTAAVLAVTCAIDGGIIELSAKTLVTLSGVMLCSLLCNAAMCLLISVIVPGAKGAVLCFIFQEALFMVFMISAEEGGIAWVEKVSYFFPQGLIGVVSLLTAPEKPWVYMLCSLGAAVVFFALGIHYFRRKDLN